MNVFLFDLDDTLYSRELGVVARIDSRINRYMAERLGIPAADVDAMRRRFWAESGTTLRGLMTAHAVDPEDYLRYVHDVELSDLLCEDRALRELLERISGVKVVFSNSCRSHATKVLSLLGVSDRFDAVLTLEDLAYVPKPFPEAYASALARVAAEPRRCVLVDDTLPNLAPARKLGMRTVWVSAAGPAEEAADFVIATVHEIERVVAELPERER